MARPGARTPTCRLQQLLLLLLLLVGKKVPANQRNAPKVFILFILSLPQCRLCEPQQAGNNKQSVICIKVKENQAIYERSSLASRGVCAIFYTLRSAARGKCQNAKRFMLIFTQREGGDERGKGKRRMEGQRYPHQVENFLSQLASTVSVKCLFRIRPGVIYGPITFNFTCGPRGMQISCPFSRWPRTKRRRKICSGKKRKSI